MGRPTSFETERRRRIRALRVTLEVITKQLQDVNTPAERIPGLAKTQVALVHSLLKLEGSAPEPEPSIPRRRGRPHSPLPRKVIRSGNSLVAIYRRFNRDIAVPVPNSHDLSPTRISFEWVRQATQQALEEEMRKLAATLGSGVPTSGERLQRGCPATGCLGPHLLCGCIERYVDSLGHACGKDTPAPTESSKADLLN